MDASAPAPGGAGAGRMVAAARDGGSPIAVPGDRDGDSDDAQQHQGRAGGDDERAPARSGGLGVHGGLPASSVSA